MYLRYLATVQLLATVRQYLKGADLHELDISQMRLCKCVAQSVRHSSRAASVQLKGRGQEVPHHPSNIPQVLHDSSTVAGRSGIVSLQANYVFWLLWNHDKTSERASPTAVSKCLVYGM